MFQKNIRIPFSSYVIPSVLAFALSGVYTIVDGFFVGQKLGDIGLAAITVACPVATLVAAIGTGIGMSGAIRYTIFEAIGDKERTAESFSGTALLMLLASVLLTLILFFCCDPILSLLGSQGEIANPAKEYARVIALGTVFQLMATGFVPFIRNMGAASFAMAAMIIGFISNIILDFLLVWVLEWGMAGAAAATVMAQAVTMIAAIVFFIRKKCVWKVADSGSLTELWKAVLKVSVSPFGLTFSPTVVLIFMNKFLLFYGTEQSVAVYGCIGYVVWIVYLLLQGVGDGAQPLMSHYYGKKDARRTSLILNLSYMTAGIVTVVCMLSIYAMRADVGVLFGASDAAIEDVVRYLPYFLLSMPFLAFVRITTSFFYATEKTKLSYLLVYAEPVLTLLGLFTLPVFLGLFGVWMATPAAQISAFIIAAIVRCKVKSA